MHPLMKTLTLERATLTLAHVSVIQQGSVHAHWRSRNSTGCCSKPRTSPGFILVCASVTWLSSMCPSSLRDAKRRYVFRALVSNLHAVSAVERNWPVYVVFNGKWFRVWRFNVVIITPSARLVCSVQSRRQTALHAGSQPLSLQSRIRWSVSEIGVALICATFTSFFLLSLHRNHSEMLTQMSVYGGSTYWNKFWFFPEFWRRNELWNSYLDEKFDFFCEYNQN